MQQETPPSIEKKQAMKKLRQERQQWIADASNRVKQQRKDLAAMKKHLTAGADTIPELARATGMKPADVLWYMAALKKYGEVVEAEKYGSYFRYAVTPKAKS